MPACMEPHTVTSASERWALQLTDACFASRAAPRTAVRAARGAARPATGADAGRPARSVHACILAQTLCIFARGDSDAEYAARCGGLSWGICG